MKIIRLQHRFVTFITIIAAVTVMAFAEPATKGKVKIQYERLADGGVRVTSVWNKSDKSIELKIDGKVTTVVNPHSSAVVNKYAYKYVRYDFKKDGGGDLLWKPSPKKEPVEEPASAFVPEPAEENKPPETSKRTAPQPAGNQERNENYMPVPETSGGPGGSVGYFDILNRDAFFGVDAVAAYIQKTEAFCRAINSSKNKQQFIIDNDVVQFVEQSKKEINDRKLNLAARAQEIVNASKLDAAGKASALTLIVETLNNRLKAREDACGKLEAVVSDVDVSDGVKTANSAGGGIAIYAIAGVIVILLAVLIIATAAGRKKNKGGKKDKGNKKDKNNKTAATLPATLPAASSSDPAIVIRRKTTSILKKQCIDDVVDNPAYMVIKASEFTTDSAVNKIYIKNSCIREVYNLYAEDLRNTDNPKEDGCMVLGRWVLDEAGHTYDISLEEVVFPGDDAVFKEYELDFGGKIKLRIAEKLRKLRRNTNLQYDLVCWIHSHPGLGVFFSNSDDNVQMQLKHSQHPNFLIAFVVDILTSGQDLGIFTFRKDGSMNSKGDITKMYSLEEMYKWALQSERNSFSHDNYFNILSNAKLKLPHCKGVELNNSSIIDLTQIVVEPETDIVGWAVGTTVETKEGLEFAVSSIVRNADRPGAGVIGCLISMTHMSLPTIQRLIVRDSVNLSFVMVYSSRQMSLTTIPVIKGELLSGEQFYSDVNIDDLKIWTRRKR